MATYPNHPIALVSAPQPEPVSIDDFSFTGVQHTLTTRSTQYYIFRVLHRYLTTKQWRSLLETYNSDPGAEYTNFTFFTESPAKTYTCKMLGPPTITANHGNGRHDVEVVLRGY